MEPDFSLEAYLKETNFPAIEDIDTLPDRAAGIVAAAIIDDRLTVAISSRLVDDKNVAKRLFSGRGPLASFGDRIDLGFLIGIYDDGYRNALHAVREIRNKFAHWPGPVRFDMPEIAKFTDRLAFAEVFAFLAETDPHSSRERNNFVAAVHIFTGLLMGLSGLQRPSFRPAIFHFEAQPISSRGKRDQRSTLPARPPNPARRARRSRRRSSPE